MARTRRRPPDRGGNRQDPGSAPRPRPRGPGPREARRGRRGGRRPAWLPWLLALGIAAAGLAAVLLVRDPSAPVAWTRFGTADVHALAFAGDSSRLLFGHHDGLLASQDGGRSWRPAGPRQDAMAVDPAGDGSLMIAGHEVFLESRDEGRTWTPVRTDLPSLDIHGFTRDPATPDRVWAVVAGMGLWASEDGGATFANVYPEDLAAPVAAGGRIFALGPRGPLASEDGGRTFIPLGSPELFPVAALAATPDGGTLVAGGPGGLSRSTDGGRTWQLLGGPGVAALALSADARTIAVVDRDTRFYRSDDGGTSWPGP